MKQKKNMVKRDSEFRLISYYKFRVKKTSQSRKNNTRHMGSEKFFKIEKIIREIWRERKFSKSEKQ